MRMKLTVSEVAKIPDNESGAERFRYQLIYPFLDAAKDLLTPNNHSLQRNCYDAYFATVYLRTTVAKSKSCFVELVGYKPRLIGYDLGWFQFVVFANTGEILYATKPIEGPPTNEVMFEVTETTYSESRRQHYMSVKVLVPENFFEQNDDQASN